MSKIVSILEAVETGASIENEEVVWLLERINELEQVLKFYADENNYEMFSEDHRKISPYIHQVDKDRGDKATEVLEGDRDDQRTKDN